MARPGRAPKPANLRLLHGDRKDRINTAEPRPRLLPAKKPGWLSPLAAEEWDRVAPDLDAMGIVKAVDATALGLYCEAVARFRSAQKLLVKSGPLIRDLTGRYGRTRWWRRPATRRTRCGCGRRSSGSPHRHGREFMSTRRGTGCTPSGS